MAITHYRIVAAPVRDLAVVLLPFATNFQGDAGDEYAHSMLLSYANELGIEASRFALQKQDRRGFYRTLEVPA